MAKMKFGVGDNVSTDSGFAPYEGPLPKPNVVYPVKQKSATIRLTGENSKNPGTAYLNTMWEITEGECKGFSAFHRVIPGETEMQQTRVAQYMQAVCGKNSAQIVHDEVEDGGKVKTIGGKNPVGTTAGMTFKRVKDSYNSIEGEEPVYTAEPNDLIPGWKPKAASAHPLPDAVEDAQEEDEELDEEFEEEDEDDVEEDADEPDSDEDDDSDEEDGDEEDSDDESDEATSFEDAAKMTLVELKALAVANDYEDGDLAQYKGPKGKKALLALLVEDEIVSAPEDTEPPF